MGWCYTVLLSSDVNTFVVNKAVHSIPVSVSHILLYLQLVSCHRHQGGMIVMKLQLQQPLYVTILQYRMYMTM